MNSFMVGVPLNSSKVVPHLKSLNHLLDGGFANVQGNEILRLSENIETFQVIEI